MNIIDMHCDTITKCFTDNKDLRNNDCHIDFLKLQKGGCLLQNFAIFTNLKYKDYHFTLDNIDFFKKQIKANEDLISQVYTYKDIDNNIKNNKMSAMLTLEDGDVINNDLKMLDYYYEQGVRMIALTWNYPTHIGYPNIDLSSGVKNIKAIDTKNGLTPFGIEYIKKMEELGIIIDVSHLSDKGFYDVLENTTKPFVASHSNARALSEIGRNLSDDMLMKMKERRCVVGINFCAYFLDEHNDKMAYIKDIVKHINYIRDFIGIDYIGFGSDFDGIGNELEFKDSSNMKQILEALKDEGYSDEDIDKISYKNVLRLYKEVLK